MGERAHEAGERRAGGSQVWKFRIPSPNEEPWVEMPKGARLLHVAVQDGIPYLWALVFPGERLVRRYVVTYATGQPIDGWPDYLGTFHIDWTVWHVFAGTSERPIDEGVSGREGTPGASG